MSRVPLTFVSGRGIALLALVVAAGCSSPSSHPGTATVAHPSPPSAPTSPSPAPPGASITVRSLFCAYGGVGSVPVPTPPDFEADFVEHAFEIDNPGPPITGLSVRDASLRDPSGAVVAPLVRLHHFVDLTHDPPSPPGTGSFGVYMNPPGVPFTGALPTGTTRLRVRYSTSGPGMNVPSHCRLTLDGLGAPVSVEGTVDGSWPTS